MTLAEIGQSLTPPISKQAVSLVARKYGYDLTARRGTPVPDAKKKAALSHLQQAPNALEAAKQAGICHDTALKLAHENGIPLVKRGRRIPDEHKQRLAELLEEHRNAEMAVRLLAQETGIEPYSGQAARLLAQKKKIQLAKARTRQPS